MANDSSRSGLLALVGGGEWRQGADFDSELLEAAETNEVVVLPTAAAYARPEKAVEWAAGWFARYGATVRGLMVLSHEDALDEENVKVVAEASFIYIGGGSPLHLRSVLKATPLYEALVASWRGGASLAASSAGAMVLCDPMVDPRGGGLGLGLGLIEQLAIVPHHDPAGGRLLWRTLELAPSDLAVAAIPEQTALLWQEGATWRAAGAKAGDVAVYRKGDRVGLEALPASRTR